MRVLEHEQHAKLPSSISISDSRKSSSYSSEINIESSAYIVKNIHNCHNILIAGKLQKVITSKKTTANLLKVMTTQQNL